MAYLDDDLQGYAIGAHPPFGSWILDDPSGVSTMVAGGPPNCDRSLRITGEIVAYVRPIGYLKTFTQWCAVRIDQPLGNFTGVFQFVHGPNPGGNYYALLNVGVINDSTVNVTCPISGQQLANSGDLLFRYGTWNFFQINVTLSDVLLGGVTRLHIDCEIAVNGKLFISFSTTTTFGVSVLTNLTAEVNRFQLVQSVGPAQYAAYTLDVFTPITLTSYPHPGTPKLILTQGVTEIGELPDTAKVFLHQGVIELLYIPSSSRRAEYIHRRHFPGD